MSVALSDFALIIFASRIIFVYFVFAFFIPTLERFRISYLFRVWYCKGSDIFLIEKLIIGKYLLFNNFQQSKGRPIETVVNEMLRELIDYEWLSVSYFESKVVRKLVVKIKHYGNNKSNGKKEP